MKRKPARKYGGDVSENTWRDFMKNGLRHIRLPSGTLLFRSDWIDNFLMQFEVNKTDAKKEIDRIVDEMTSSVSD